MVTMPVQKTSSDAAIGITWKVISAFVFTCMLVIVKMAADRLPVGELLFARNIFGLIPVVIVMAVTGHLRTGLKTKSVSGHLRRGVFGMISMGLWFAALDHLSLPEATSIVYAAPLMMVILAALVLGETVRVYRWSAVAVGFVGVIVILWPQIANGFDVANDTAALGAALALGSAAFMSVTSVFVRQLAVKEPTMTIVLYFLITGTIVSAATFPTWVVPSWGDFGLMVAIGVLGGIGQVMITQAYHHAEASLIAPFEYTSMIWVTAFGYMVFGEVPTINVVIGAAIVISSGIFVIWRERRLGLHRAERKVGAPLRH